MSVSGLMTQRSSDSLTPLLLFPAVPLFFFFSFFGHLICLLAGLCFKSSSPNPRLLRFYSQNHLLCVSFLCGLREDMFNFNYLGKLSKAGSVCFERKHYLEPQAAGVGYFSLPSPLSLISLPRGLSGWRYRAFSSEKTF